MARSVETQVLIVGAGPVGLSLALDLGWRGVGCTIIDQGDGAIDHPKAGLIAVLYEKTLVLVRPDGHVAWRSDALPWVRRR